MKTFERLKQDLVELNVNPVKIKTKEEKMMEDSEQKRMASTCKEIASDYIEHLPIDL
jgi:hypothetical protein